MSEQQGVEREGAVDATVLDAQLRRIRVVLVHTSHPGNIGAAARAMWTMGLSQLFLVAPARFPAPEATAMASGADALLQQAQVVPTLADALSGCVWTVGLSARPREFAGQVLSVRSMGEAIAQRLIETSGAGADGAEMAAADMALVLGTEMSGLSNAELAQCAAAVTIPSNPQYSSLNLASAVQVASYEMRMALSTALLGAAAVWSAPRFAPATNDAIERLYVHAEKTLIASGFLNPTRPKRLLPRLRRLFARAGLEHEEVNILRGILAEMDALIAQRDASSNPR